MHAGGGADNGREKRNVLRVLVISVLWPRVIIYLALLIGTHAAKASFSCSAVRPSPRRSRADVIVSQVGNTDRIRYRFTGRK